MTRLVLFSGIGLLARAFTVIFATLGALCERLSRVPLRALRYLMIGAVVGAPLARRD